MKLEGPRAQIGDGSKPRYRGGPVGPVGAVENLLKRDFAPEAPNKVWVTDISTSAPTKAGCFWRQ